MTREEAIKKLEVLTIMPWNIPELLEALDMAIEALQAQPTHGRLIDANALMEYCSNQKTKTIDNNDIARFPTICYDGDDYWNDKVPIHNKPINASWVINEIHKNICDMCEQGIDIEDCNDCKIDRIKRIIYSAPTIQADQTHGEWILECDSEGDGDNLYRCSECGCEYGCQEYDKPNFCLECGARMYKGGEE